LPDVRIGLAGGWPAMTITAVEIIGLHISAFAIGYSLSYLIKVFKQATEKI